VKLIVRVCDQSHSDAYTDKNQDDDCTNDKIVSNAKRSVFWNKTLKKKREIDFKSLQKLIDNILKVIPHALTSAKGSHS